MRWLELYRQRVTTAEEAVKAIRSGDHVWIHSGCSNPEELISAMVARAGELEGVEVSHILTLGHADYVKPQFASSFRHRALFAGANVRDAVRRLGVDYPVAMDNDFAIWRAFKNQYWPAHYFIDAQGRIRHHHFGEGDYEGSERVIQQLLKEAGAADVAADVVQVQAQGAEAAAAMDQLGSPETYVGYARAENFRSPGGLARDVAKAYVASPLHLNDWSLVGRWRVTREHAELAASGGRYSMRLALGFDPVIGIRIAAERLPAE